MKVAIVIFHLLVFYSTSQAQFYDIKIGESKYIFNESEIFVINYELKNTCSDTLCVISLGRDSLLNDSLLVKKFFWQRRPETDASLFQIAFDGSITEYTPVIFETFVKIIPPNSSFTFQILSDYKMNSSCRASVLRYLKSKIIVFPVNDYLKEISPPFTSIIFYKESNIILPVDKLYNNIRNR
jgi:hypothetical protein